MKKIIVNSPGKKYPVYYGSGLLKRLNDLIKKHKLNKNIFLIVDEKVYSLYKKSIDSTMSDKDSKIFRYLIKADENSKSLNNLEDIFSQLIKNNFGRDTLIIAIGGGITGDIAGLSASTYSRGVQLVHIPTTLLAMVDSSVGGKTGVNFKETKNLIGTFYQPELVLIDTNFLSTLTREEILCGVGEIVKYSFVVGDNFYYYVQKNLESILSLDTNTLLKIIHECVGVKASVVEKDEREESGLRKILNLGHTFGHAVEVEQKYRLKHGEAVVCGLSCALHLSNKLNLLSDENLAKYLSLIVKLSEYIKIEMCDNEKLFEIMKRDKKSRDNKIKFVLPKRAGDLVVDIEAGKEDVAYALKNGLEYFKY